MAIACLTLAAAQPALSQTTAPRRPAGGLFGATRADVGTADKLNVTFELAQGIDSDLPPELGGGIATGGSGSGGLSTLFSADSEYSHTGRTIQVAAAVGTAFKYYQQLEHLDALSHNAGLGIGIRLPKNGTFNITQAAAYSPSYLYQLFPEVDAPALGESIAINSDYKIDQNNSLSYLTRMAVQFGSALGTQLITSGQYRVTEYEAETSTRPSLETRGAGATVSHALSRNASFSLGYNYEAGEFGFAEPSYQHQSSIGIAYSPALSRTRRLNIRFNAAPSWLKVPAPALEPADAAEIAPYLYRLQGDVSVSYPFMPNWRTAVTYHRGVEYLAGLSEPLLSDGTRATITGLLSRRVDLDASFGLATATSAIPGANQNLDTYTGTLKMRYAFKRSVALYGEYLYYQYHQQGESSLVPDLPPLFSQHGVRLGVTLFVEALR